MGHSRKNTMVTKVAETVEVKNTSLVTAIRAIVVVGAIALQAMLASAQTAKDVMGRPPWLLSRTSHLQRSLLIRLSPNSSRSDEYSFSTGQRISGFSCVWQSRARCIATYRPSALFVDDQPGPLSSPAKKHIHSRTITWSTQSAVRIGGCNAQANSRRLPGD